jgi:hypothetical protein
VSATVRKKPAARKKRLFQQARRIAKRLANTPQSERPAPMMTATNIHYQPAGRVRGLSAGGIGTFLLLARYVDLINEIDQNLDLLKRHLPYHESDHVLNIAFNILAGGERLEHLKLRRNDEVRPSHEQAAAYLDKAINLCRQAGFRRITLRGDTDFSQTQHLVRWDKAGETTFLFGLDAHPEARPPRIVKHGLEGDGIVNGERLPLSSRSVTEQLLLCMSYASVKP